MESSPRTEVTRLGQSIQRRINFRHGTMLGLLRRFHFVARSGSRLPSASLILGVVTWTCCGRSSEALDGLVIAYRFTSPQAPRFQDI